MNSTKINSVQFNTESTINTARNSTKKLKILNSCLICTKLIKETSAHKTALFSENFKTFCEFFSLNETNCNDFVNKFRTSSLCHRCKERISQIAKVVREVDRLNKQLDTLRKSVCLDLTQVNDLLASSVLENVNQDSNSQYSNSNKSNQENQCEIILQQKFRKLLEERLAIPISSRSLVKSTQETSDEHRDPHHNSSSLDHPKSGRSNDDGGSTNGEVADTITITVFPSSSNSSDRSIIEIQGADAINTESSDEDFPEICPTSLDTITDSCNDLHGFASRYENDFEEDDIKIEENEDVSSALETTAVDEIRTNSATDIEVDLNRNYAGGNDTRNGIKIQKSKHVIKPIDIGIQPPAESPIKLKNAVVILTRLSPRSVAKLSRSNVPNVNQVKTVVSINTETHTCSANSNSGQDTSTFLSLNKPSTNELNSGVESVTLSSELISSSLQEASAAAIEVQVENFSDLLDADNIVEVEVATETDTTIQDVCGSPKATAALSNKLIAHKAVLKFQCPFVDPVKGYCPKKGQQFINQKLLDAHLNRVHNGKKKHHEYQCKKCHVGVNSLKRLLEHEKIHSGVKEFICKTCDESFRTENFLLFHQRKVHGEPYPFLCDLCSKGFNYECLLRAHMRSHTGELRFRCEECKTGFHSQSALNDHIITHASEEQVEQDVCELDKELSAPSDKLNTPKAVLKFECPFVDPAKGYCPKMGRRYLDQQRLDAHLNRMHNSKKKYHEYVCKQCHIGVNSLKRLREHEKIHSGVKDMICGTCAESFRTKNLLLFHQRKVHGDLYPFLCDICSKGFNFESHLRTHMQQSHGGEFRFQCEECKAGFYYRSALNNHMFSHAKERQFVCECCSKKFTTKGNWTRHMTTHLENKAWLCDTCGKSFWSRDELKNHWEVHRTDKSYACQMCEFKTKTKACLQNHSRRYCKNRKKT